jgi:hypothetical protein
LRCFSTKAETSGHTSMPLDDDEDPPPFIKNVRPTTIRCVNRCVHADHLAQMVQLVVLLYTVQVKASQVKFSSNFNGGRARRLWGARPAREIGRARRGATGMAGEP